MTVTSTGRAGGAPARPRTGADTGDRPIHAAGPATSRYVPMPGDPSRQAVATPAAATPAAAPPRRWTLAAWAAGGLVVGLLGVLAMLVAVGWPVGPTELTGPTGPSAADRGGPGPAAVAPSPPTGTAVAAFPDVAALGDRCAPYRVPPGEYVTSTGAHPVAVVLCDYGAAVPGGYVYYTEWPTPADAQQWHDDQRSWGPSLDGLTVWGHGIDQRQGPLHRRTAPDGTVYATAAYSGRPYTFDIITRSLDDSNRMFPAMHLLPATSLPTGR